ncbi:Vacuolar protein sorting-associated protein 5 [Sticta canariensis]|nr:Vacuolar protein sorting-associated protein 5 [Sticta canariensis]
MDTEVSPWNDVPSRSGSNTNIPTADVSEPPESEARPKLSQASAHSESQTPRPPSARGSRTPRRVGTQATRLEAVDDSLGPLGPLGDDSPIISELGQPPAPPSKEQSLPVRNARQAPGPSQSPMSRSMMDSVDLGDDDKSTTSRVKYASHGQSSPAVAENSRRQTQPSVSIEQAARPSFDITVGDPHKVGDLTSSHIVYQVRTKTSSKAYKQPEFAVSRRYKDFLWLYNSLHNNNPGVVVPPPPEKQAVGRFDSSFVESRRAALERMLNKTATHPILQHDADLKIFLESDAFNMDVKHREHKEPGLGESKGMFSSIGFGAAGSGKFIEHDDWFHDRRVYLDALENQLKALLKAIDTVVSQRKALAEAAGDLSASLHALSSVELSVSLSAPLEGLSDLQLRIRELYERQAQQDVLTLGITVDEYIRLISSIKMAFAQRQKSFHSWHSAEAELSKRKSTQEKVLRSGKTQQDRLNQLQADVGEGERKCHQARLLFEDMGRLMRGELERFEREKVEDFKSGVETFLEGAIEAQKELIELWETFLMQLDADEDGEPFFRPPVIAPSPPPSHTQQQPQQQQDEEAQSRNPTIVEPGGENERPQASAAMATVDQEE